MAGLLTADPVAQELRRWLAEPFVWGETDCGLSILAYAERMSGRAYDGAHLHTYRDARGAAEFLREQGGYQAYVDRVLTTLGWETTQEPRRGDVGMLRLTMGLGLTMCLCLGGAWAARGDRETIIIKGAALAAWRAPCLKQ